MNFVNKLSVVSLLVLMFSFMNIAQAANPCTGTAVNACSKITDQSKCANSYLSNNDGTVPNANGVAIAITAAQHVELLITSVQRDIALTMENASQIMTVNDGGGS